MNWVTIGATQAFDLAVVQDGTVVVGSSHYLLGGASGPKVHSLQTVTHLASDVATLVGVTQAQLDLEGECTRRDAALVMGGHSKHLIQSI